MTELFAGPFGPLIIFGLRIVDVSLATIRMLFVMRNARKLVPVIGLAESLVWVVAVGTAITNLHSIWHVLGYSGGFATGTWVGLWLEGKLAVGLATVRVISRAHGEDLAEGLRARGFGATEFQGYGREGRVDLVYTLVRRRQIPEVIDEVERWDREAFVSVEEPRVMLRGWMFPLRRK